ncbi:MAG: PDZ domain-containing protein [Fimbriimonadaceae bacterium]|nr:PDZ domain-containing protein [Fimbriimonadaceae bacterium]
MIGSLSLAILTLHRPQVAAPIAHPFRVSGDGIIVDLTVNGRKVTCMFDTGFGGTLVLNSSVNVGPISGTMTLRDFVGELEASTVKVKSMSVGGLTVPPGDKTVVSRPGDYSFAYNTHVDGILGLEPFLDVVTEINFEKKQLIFHPKTTDITKRVPDNKRTFLAKLLPTGGNSLEMAVEVSTGKRLIMALDTGNGFYATTHKDSLDRVGLWPIDRVPKFMSSSFVASGEVNSWTYRMDQAKIYGVPVDVSYWDVIDLPSSSADADGTVGFGFLENFNVILDLNRRRVWLDNFKGTAANDEIGDVGMSAGFDPNRKRTRVARVAPESPAALAGIEEGDDVLSVDGQELIEATFDRMRTLLRGKVGSKVKLVISRSGELKRLELERKSLVNVSPGKERLSTGRSRRPSSVRSVGR